MVRIEDILFWILILAAIGIAVWMLFGSPDLVGGLISIMIFVAGSEILLWKFLFSLDKRAALGFQKVSRNIKEIKQNAENTNLKINEINDSIMELNKNLRRRIR